MTPAAASGAPRRGVGLLGGTFDPVHTGHIALAKRALEAMPLARVEFVLAARPWQKSVVTALEDRAAMVREAIRGEEGLELNLLEAMRPGATYTIDTLREMRRILPSSTPLVLLIGFDQWLNLSTWKDWRAIADEANIAVFNRGDAPGKPPAEVAEWGEPRFAEPRRLAEVPSGAIAFVSMEPHSASSSALRRLLSSSRSRDNTDKLFGWLPHGVARYINQHGLYSRNFSTWTSANSSASSSTPSSTSRAGT